MQTCYNCGKNVSDETLICPDCGALVRRYTSPPPKSNEPPQSEPPRQGWEQQAWNPPQQPWNAQQSWNAPQNQEQPAKPHKVRLYGGVKAWLIFLVIFSAYMAFNSLCTVALCLNTDYFVQMLQEPGMEAYASLLNEYLDLLPQVLPLFLGMTVLFVAKLVFHSWLLHSGRKLPFYLSIGVSIVALGSLALLGGTILTILYFFDPFFTWMGLKRFWPWMPK